jgi:hypothetical protein
MTHRTLSPVRLRQAISVAFDKRPADIASAAWRADLQTSDEDDVDEEDEEDDDDVDWEDADDE